MMLPNYHRLRGVSSPKLRLSRFFDTFAATGDFLGCSPEGSLVNSDKMDAVHPQSDEKTIADLAAKVRSLEAELAQARAHLTTTHCQLLAEKRILPTGSAMEQALSTASAIRHTEQKPEAHPLPIRPERLPLQHPLRRKWALGKGLPDASTANDSRSIRLTGNHSAKGKLRLFGLLSDGSTWEHYISFARLAKEDGITLGRDPKSVDLEVPENGVSRRHARLELGPTGLVITDLDSTNGLFVNGQQITRYSPKTMLTDGSTINLGDTPLRVEIIRNAS